MKIKRVHLSHTSNPTFEHFITAGRSLSFHDWIWDKCSGKVALDCSLAFLSGNSSTAFVNAMGRKSSRMLAHHPKGSDQSS